MPAETPYIAQIEKWDDEDTSLTAAKQVEQLTQHPGWTQLLRLLDAAEKNALDRLLNMNTARVPEQAEYARLTGFLAGLREPTVAAKAFQVYAERVTRRNEQDLTTP